MKKTLDSNMIKVIAIIAMTIDHITWMLFPGYPKEIVPIVLHMIGRITCPIMCLFYRGGIPLHKRYQQIYKTFICVCGYLAFCICVCICGFCGLEIIHSFLLWKCLKPDKRYVVACVGAGAAAGSGQPQDKAECGKNIACHTYLCHQFPERLELRCQPVHFSIRDKPGQV